MPATARRTALASLDLAGLPWNDPRRQPGYLPAPDLASSAYQDAETERQYRQLRARRAAQDRADSEDRNSSGDPALFRAADLNDAEDPPPLVLGAEGIFPACGVHYLFGKPNVGKTPLLAYTALDRVRAGREAGERFGVYELEMGQPRWKRMLTELGATPEEISRILYYSDMAAPVDLAKHGRALCARALDDGCLGLGIDSMVAMLAVSRINENDPTAVRDWVSNALRPMALAGGSAIILDHTGHGDQDRPRASSDKTAGCDTSISMRADTPGKRGVSGCYTLICIKDRDAQLINDSMVLRHKAGENGEFTYEPQGWMSLAMSDVKTRITAPRQSRILAYLTDLPRPVTVPQIARELGFGSETIRSALRRGSEGPDAVFTQVRRGFWEANGRTVG